MLEFFSEENLQIHKESVQQKKLKLSILEKSINEIKSRNIRDIMGQKLKKADKEDTLALLADIRLHELFFSSFGDKSYIPSALVRTCFGSEAAFLNEMFRLCMSQPLGFVAVFLEEKKVRLECADVNLYRLFLVCDPCLAVDVSEHAYFLDYGFDKERYLRASLPFLDVSRLK